MFNSFKSRGKGTYFFLIEEKKGQRGCMTNWTILSNRHGV